MLPMNVYLGYQRRVVNASGGRQVYPSNMMISEYLHDVNHGSTAHRYC